MSPLVDIGFASPLDAVIHSADDDSCSESCLTRWKIAFAFILLVEGLVFGHAAYFVKRFTAARAFQASMHIGNALSAGVFFAAGMLHVFPEATALLAGGEDSEMHHEERQEDDHDHDEGEHGAHGAEFPWAPLVLMLSFYFLFFVEQIFIPKLSRRHGAEEPLDKTASKTAEESNGEEVHLTAGSESEYEKELTRAGFKSKEFLRGLIQILGISAHSLFESMALGLSQEFDTVLNIFIATVSHRWATSLALSFKLSRALSYWAIIVLITIFSAMVPIGIGIGAALSQLSEKVQGVLFAISAGTFLYIGVYESMAEEFALHKKWQGRKFAATLLGAGIIVLTTILLVRFEVHG